VEMRERCVCVTVRGRGGRKRTQPVGWPPDWVDDAAGPASHGLAPATSLVAFFGDFAGTHTFGSQISPWVSENLSLYQFLVDFLEEFRARFVG